MPVKSQFVATIHQPLFALASSSLLAFSGAWLNSSGPPRLGFCLFVGLGILIVTGLKAREGTLNRRFVLLGSSALLFCFFLIWRSALVLQVLNLLCLLVIACVAYQARRSDRFPYLPFGRWLMSPFKLAAQSLATPLTNLRDLQELDATVTSRAVVRNIFAGLVLSLPVILLFGGLLTASDARYSQFIAKLFSFDGMSILEYAGEWLICWVAACALLDFVLRSQGDSVTEDKGIVPAVNGIRVIVVLASLVLLFSSYLSVQATYFFGSDALVRNTDGLTYSQYARQGFWELVWVALGSISLIYTLHFAVADEPDGVRGWVLRLSLLLVALNTVLLASACHRMSLYILAYDLSQLRFYASFFLAFVFILLIIMTLRLLNRKLSCLPWDTIMVALLMIVALNVVNPNLLIARYNLTSKKLTATSDAMYFALGKDAIEALIEYSSRTPAMACRVRQRLLAMVGHPPGWRHWTWADVRARAALSRWDVGPCPGDVAQPKSQ